MKIISHKKNTLCPGRSHAATPVKTDNQPAPLQIADCYTPIDGGWHICITGANDAARPAPESRVGVVQDNARLHRRPLYPPADKALLWNRDDLAKIERCGFRPLILAYNEPRFLFDLHSGGGLAGHLFIGLITERGVSRWFHQWTEIDVSYVDGRMEYILHDAAFPGVTVALVALPLAGSVGFLVKYEIQGLSDPASLIWSYGGASAFYTNYDLGIKVFTFAPEQCAKDRIRWENGAFSLRRKFDPTDGINRPYPDLLPVDSVVPHLTDWEAVIQGAGFPKGRMGLGNPEAVLDSPGTLREVTDWSSPKTLGPRSNCVAVQSIPLAKQHNKGYIVIGTGGNIKKALAHPAQAYKAALHRNREIAGRIVTHTADPYLDAAMTMLAFQTEGTWGDVAILHGAWSWRQPYLGWRNLYGPNCYGWTERVKRSIQNNIRLGLAKDGPDKGCLGSIFDLKIFGEGFGFLYNMNEVFLDGVRHYFEHTNDLETMRAIFPVLKGIVEWENRRLQPGNAHLYENCLNTWISDSHWYIRGQCTQASAYMLQAHAFLADLAARFGENPAPFRESAENIRSAMQRNLWQRRQGVFAEYQDTLGHRLLHPEPELPTIYHSAEFGAASRLQVYQMVHWVDTHLRSSTTAGGGKMYWSNNWFPNQGRLYTNSTYDVVYAEELNFALTNYLAGRADDAYALIRSCLCGIFNGPTPGGLSCHAHTDGRQRFHDEFADASSMWGRTIVEGLFGIVPRKPDGIMELCPQFPSDWTQASIRTPYFSCDWKCDETSQCLTWKSPEITAVHLRLPLHAEVITRLVVNNRPAEWQVEAGYGLTWLIVKTPPGKTGRVTVSYKPSKISNLPEQRLRPGDQFRLNLFESGASDFVDPQGILTGARVADGFLQGTVEGNVGPGLLFLKAGTGSCPTWLPLKIQIESRQPEPCKIWSPPDPQDKDLSNWSLVDVRSRFNCSIPEVLDRVLKAAQPPALPADQIGFKYRNEHLKHRSYVSPSDAAWRAEHKSPGPLSDAAWRAKVGPDGIAWTTDGIPFKTVKEGPNIAIVTLMGGFPAKLEFPVHAQGGTMYLMISGMTFPVQSHVVNVRVTLCYADAKNELCDLVSPFNIGNCWCTWIPVFHDTPANGFENIGGRLGPEGSAQVADMTQPVETDTEAHLVPIQLRQDITLDSIEFEAIANDVVFGLMGVSILKKLNDE